MRKSLAFVGLSVLLLMVGCNKNNWETDPDYPTIIEEMDKTGINQIAGELGLSPMADCQSVDDFGFPLIDLDDSLCIDTDNWIYYATSKELADSAQAAIFRYSHLLNVADTSEIQISSIISTDQTSYEAFYEEPNDSGPPAWIVTTRPQQYNNLEIYGSSLKVVLAPDHIAGIAGHWFDKIYIPASDNLSEAEAKESLYNRTFTYKSRYEIIPTSGMTWHESKRVIIPVRRSNTIELRLCWALYPSTWEITVDTQTGEVITKVDISVL